MCTVFLNCVEVEREGDIKEVGRDNGEGSSLKKRRGEWGGEGGGRREEMKGLAAERNV